MTPILGKKQQISERDLVKILKENGFILVRNNGSHKIFKKQNTTVTVSKNINIMVARRILKENNLVY